METIILVAIGYFIGRCAYSVFCSYVRGRNKRRNDIIPMKINRSNDALYATACKAYETAQKLKTN